MQRALCVLCLVLLAGCTTFGTRLPPGTAGGSFLDEGPAVRMRGEMSTRRQALDATEQARTRAHYRVLRDLVASSAALREQMRRRKDMLRNSFEEDHNVSDLEKQLVIDGAVWFVQLDTLLYSLWLSYRDYLPFGSEPDPYAPQQAASLLDDDTRAKGGLVALAAEIVRMDNAAAVTTLLGDQIALTRFLNRGDRGHGIPPESFDRVLGSLKDPERRAQLQRQLFAISRNAPRLTQLGREDGEVAFLLSLIERSPVARAVLEERGLGRQLRFLGAAIAQSGAALLSPLIDGYLAIVVDDADEAKEIARERAVPLHVVDAFFDTLRAHDIVFVRDITREGASSGFTHAWLYLGELSALRAAAPEHPAFIERGARLRRGHVFVEAGKTGVSLRQLDAASDAQVLTVLRLRGLDPVEAARRSLGAMVDRGLTSPPKLYPPDHSARLLSFVHVGTPPTFLRAVDHLARSGEADVVWFAQGDQVAAGEAAAAELSKFLEGAGPNDEVGIARARASE